MDAPKKPLIFVPVALSLGGNLGAETVHFSRAAEALARAGLLFIRQSSARETIPVDCLPGTPIFVNAALAGYWPGSAPALLALTQQLEIAAGRPPRHGINTPRPLDIDLIVFGGETIDLQELKIPHPRARLRRFVLEPLAEIVPRWRFPDGQTILETFQNIRSAE